MRRQLEMYDADGTTPAMLAVQSGTIAIVNVVMGEIDVTKVNKTPPFPRDMHLSCRSPIIA